MHVFLHTVCPDECLKDTIFPFFYLTSTTFPKRQTEGRSQTLEDTGVIGVDVLARHHGLRNLVKLVFNQSPFAAVFPDITS